FRGIADVARPTTCPAVTIGARPSQDCTVKKDLHRPRHSAIILIVTAAGSHPDCRAVLIQIVALYPLARRAPNEVIFGEDGARGSPRRARACASARRVSPACARSHFPAGLYPLAAVGCIVAAGPAVVLFA